MKTCILAVIYYEPEYVETLKSIAATGLPSFFVDRLGYGGLADAFNRGFQRVPVEYDYVWFMTNPVFQPEIAEALIAAMPGYAAVSPAFPSDHAHLKPCGQDVVREVPFVEFTAPMVRRDVYQDFPLDGRMPYIGHDLDWGYRIRSNAMKMGVHHGAVIGHKYIRHSDRGHPITRQRARARKAAVEPTVEVLIEKHGPNWRDLLEYHGAA